MKNLALPKKVVRFGSSKVEDAVFERNGKPMVRICGISYRTNKENRDLADKYKLEAPSLPFSIALLHGTVGNPGPHASYCSFRIDDIAKKDLTTGRSGIYTKSRSFAGMTQLWYIPEIRRDGISAKQAIEDVTLWK